MTLPEFLSAILELMWAGVAIHIPAAIGATVPQAWLPFLPWRQRLILSMSSISISYYVTLGFTEIFHIGPVAAEGWAFVIAMVAFWVVLGVQEARARNPQAWPPAQPWN